MPDLSGLGPVLTLLGTFGGVWVVVILFRWLQRDFVNAYRAELEELRAELAAARRETDVERLARQHAESRAAQYRYELLEHGIAPRPEPTTGD